jgi:hypothetical protein
MEVDAKSGEIAADIEAARQHLGHRDICTTSSHYVEKRKRGEIKLPIGESTKLLAVASYSEL